MKAIILAAGQGTRLLPFTRNHPKCLVPVGGKAILDHQLDALAANGVRDIVVVGGYHLPRIAEHLAANGAHRARLLCNPFWAVANSISSVWTARAELSGEVAILNGDTIFSPALIGAALARAGAGVSLLVEPADDFQLDDMLVAIEAGRVRAVGKALAEGDAGARSLGFIVLKDGGAQAYAAALEEVICADGGHGRFHHAVIDRLAWDDAVAAIAGGGPDWIEIDRPEDIARWQTR